MVDLVSLTYVKIVSHHASTVQAQASALFVPEEHLHTKELVWQHALLIFLFNREQIVLIVIQLVQHVRAPQLNVHHAKGHRSYSINNALILAQTDLQLLELTHLYV